MIVISFNQFVGFKIIVITRNNMAYALYPVYITRITKQNMIIVFMYK